MSELKAAHFLKRPLEIMEERGKQYDSPEGERSMGKTVTAFNTITGKDLTEAEGWLLMECLKNVRQWQNSTFHSDSAEDGVAYSALKAEALAKETSTQKPNPSTDLEATWCPNLDVAPPNTALIDITYKDGTQRYAVKATNYKWKLGSYTYADSTFWRFHQPKEKPFSSIALTASEKELWEHGPKSTDPIPNPWHRHTTLEMPDKLKPTDLVDVELGNKAELNRRKAIALDWSNKVTPIDAVITKWRLHEGDPRL